MTWQHKFFGQLFYSSRWQSQIGPTADFDGAAFYIFRDSNFVPTIWKL